MNSTQSSVRVPNAESTTEQARSRPHEPSIGSVSDPQNSLSSSLHSLNANRDIYHDTPGINDDGILTDFASISQPQQTIGPNFYSCPNAQQSTTYMPTPPYNQTLPNQSYGQWGTTSWNQQHPQPYQTAFPYNTDTTGLQEATFDQMPMVQRNLRMASMGEYNEQFTPGGPRRSFARSRQNTVVDSAVMGGGTAADSLIEMQLSRHKLKATSRTSALIAGFAMVALVELDLQGSNYISPSTMTNETASPVISPVPKPILILFAVVTTLLVSVHLLAMMMGTCMLPHMEALGTSVQNSPHHKLRYYIELSWFFSTCLGLILFLAEIGIIFWVKFLQINYQPAAAVATILLIPIFFIFMLFTYHFYRKLMTHHFTRLSYKLKQMQQEEELGKFTFEDRRNQEMYSIANMA